MNPQEREQLGLFLQQLTQARAGQKDAEADALIRDACARQPDSGYLLVQRAMQLEHVLQATQAQVGQLQAELAQARPAAGNTSFLEGGNAWGRSAAVAPAAQPIPGGAPNPVMQPRAAGVPAAAAAPAPSSWGSGILGNVATTAAGVVAGSFLYQGISSLMGHHGGGWGNAANAHDAPVAENTTINNYYGESAPADAELASNEDDVDVADSGADFGGGDDLTV
jgi:hypothetical protein